MSKISLGANFTMFLLVLGMTIGLAFNSMAQTVSKLGVWQSANLTAGQDFVVTNADDHGPGSLREAIINANANLAPSPDRILFNIPGPGVKVIHLLTPLPEISDRLVIDGASQPGYAGTPLVELDGSNAGLANGFVITAANSFVGGLAIGNFQGAGIVLRSSEGSTIWSNYIGLDATGTIARPNNIGIQVVSESRNNLIGGEHPGMRNVISGNLSDGVQLNGSSSLIEANFIGTNAAGTAAIGNGASGVKLGGPNNVIGGLIPAVRNIISGNRVDGVLLLGTGSRVQGNFIGTDVTGALDLGNEGQGVSSFADDALIGGTVPEARNVIAGNGGFGNVVLGVTPLRHGAVVQGNYIGTDVTGTRVLGGTGIAVFSDHNFIGGTVAGAQNVISGNSTGILLGSRFGGPAHENIIQGNLVGLNAPGTGPLPNTAYGILVQEGSSRNTIGANKIAFNGKSGIAVTSGNRNSVRGNSIFSNGELGIDLGSPGITPNDPRDPDLGGNNLQNFPLITSVLSFVNGTTVHGSLNSTPNTTFVIDFYSNAALDPSGNGEGAVFLNSLPVTTDGNGDAPINVTLPASLGTGRVLTATATDPDGNTSEFSASESAGVSGNLQFSVSSIRVTEDVGTVNVTVLRKGGSSGTLTVDYTTTDGTATAGQDYHSASGTLTFNEGETSQSFQILIIDDVLTEPAETFTVSLNNAANPEYVGSPSTLVVTIQDQLQLLVEQLGPTVNQAVALDALFLARDPFPITGIPESFAHGLDRNTRVMFFVRNLPLNSDSPFTVTVELQTPNKIFTVPAEDVRAVPNQEWAQVVMRLPDDLPAGVIVTVRIRVAFAGGLSLTSNTGTIRIAP